MRWVGVSAQQVGVVGGDAILGESSGGGRRTDPERYGSLEHPGDAYSYHIFTQAGTAAVCPETGPSPLGDLVPTHLVAAGESQSAFFMTTYANAIQPITGLFDGFLVHSRGRSAAPLDGSGIVGGTAPPTTAAIRDDTAVPVMIFETETDLTYLGYAAARNRRIRSW